MKSINIVNLLEQETNTNLFNNVQSKLIDKIQSNFNGPEKQIAIATYYCHVNCKPTDFVIDLDDIWKWMGYAQKVKAKLLLEKHFTLNVDYQMQKTQHESAKQQGGHNKDIFMLTLTTFKMMCLLADTTKSKEMRCYFAKLESILYQTLDEETEILRQQLEQKDEAFELLQSKSIQETMRAVEHTLISQFPVNTQCVYIGKIDDTNENGEMLLKFGNTNNLKTRVQQHKNTFTNFVLLKAFKVANKVQIENLIKTHPKITKHIRTIRINNKPKTEIIAYNAKFSIEVLVEYVQQIITESMCTVDNFNKLTRENEFLLKEIEDLKQQQQQQALTSTASSTPAAGLTPVDTVCISAAVPDKHVKFQEFINEMCLCQSDMEETGIDLEGAFRIWLKGKPTKETFLEFKRFLDHAFKYGKLSVQNKPFVVYGYFGIKLKPIQYTKKYIENYNDVETFLFDACTFSPAAKTLTSRLVSEYQQWKQSLNKPLLEDDSKQLADYLSECEYVLKSAIWANNGSNMGYYGIQLKIDEDKPKPLINSTGKTVQKINLQTGEVIASWDSIAKAAADENVSRPTMSRHIKHKVEINNEHYYQLV